MGRTGRGGAVTEVAGWKYGWTRAHQTSRVIQRRRPLPLFEATIDTTEEAIVNSVLKATTVYGFHNHHADAVPIPNSSNPSNKLPISDQARRPFAFTNVQLSPAFKSPPATFRAARHTASTCTSFFFAKPLA